MSTDVTSNTAKLLLLLGMQLGRSQSGASTSPFLTPRGDGSSLLGPLTPGQLLDQSLGLAPGMGPCDDPASLVEQLLDDLFHNGQDNSALSLLNNQSMSEVLALLLALADQADQQLNQLGQQPMCLPRGIANPFLAGSRPCFNPCGWGNEDGGSYMEMAALFSSGFMTSSMNGGYGSTFASSMFFGMDASFGYGFAGSGGYCIGGGGHARPRGRGGMGEFTMDACCYYSEDCDDDDDDCDMDCNMDLDIDCDYDDDCDDDCDDDDDDDDSCGGCL